MHKDQIQVKGDIIPLLLSKAMGDSASSALECTLLTRAFLKGPDPLFLMEVCPDHFNTLCTYLGLPFKDGRVGIETAHETGPGCFLTEGRGLPSDFNGEAEAPLPWRQEALWLLLANCSICTEGGYPTSVSIGTRLGVVASSVSKLQRLCAQFQEGYSPWEEVQFVLFKFRKLVTFSPGEKSIPIADSDIGPYIGFKDGHKVVGFKSEGRTFYGTVPGTTLDEQGIQVQVKLSETYGFNRDWKP